VRSTNPFTRAPAVPGDYHLSSGSYAVGTGTALPVFSDFFRTPRTSPYDLGAVGY
jgi:hypothetical protein